MNIIESVALAMNSVKANKLRTFLTLLSVTIGVFAITGTGALIESINSTMTKELESLGETVYYISKTPIIQSQGGPDRRRYTSRKNLDYRLFKNLVKHSKIPKEFCAFYQAGGYVIKKGNQKTENNVWLVGASETLFTSLNYPIETGRTFTQYEVTNSSNVAVVGMDIIIKIFSNEQNPLGKQISINNRKFTVIGILTPRGSMMGQSQDNIVVIPITYFLKYYATSEYNFNLQYALKAPSKKLLEASMDETIGVLRNLRNCKPGEENDFEVEDNAAISEQFSNITKYLAFFGAACGLVALIAAGVGIMNIMLVSVKERTREIGIRKAVGAKTRSILFQFLIESVTLCQFGAFIGIIIGVSIGAIFGKLVGMGLGIPYFWIIFSIIICTILGIVSGAYPAWRAAKLDPIEALRNE